MPFILPFEEEIHKLDEQINTLPVDSAAYIRAMQELRECESRVYPNLSAYEQFVLSGHPLRPKTFDYIKHIFQDVQLYSDPDIRGDHMMIAGEARIEIDHKLIDVILVGQQTGPSVSRDQLLKLPIAEYQRWNQGMGFPDGYRKAVYAMDLAEQRGWPVVVFVDTPGADPSEYSEEQGQAFAINEVIHKTTSLKTPNLSYIISLGASGGAIAITPTNRTIINQYATYMVISPGGCASILFRNRSPESIRTAAEGLCLTSSDALQQGTVDEVVSEGIHPGHRYPDELLESGKNAVIQNLAQILNLKGQEAESARRNKFYAMGVWGTLDDDNVIGGDDTKNRCKRKPETLASIASQQNSNYAHLLTELDRYLAEANTFTKCIDGNYNKNNNNNGSNNKDQTKVDPAQIVENRLKIARILYAIEECDGKYINELLGFSEVNILSGTQWKLIQEYVLERRYGDMQGASSLHPNGGSTPYRRLHPVDWIRILTLDNSFSEFAETINYCSVDQLQFPQYLNALERGIVKTNLETGLVTGSGIIGKYPAVLAVNNFGLVGSSLCDEISEKFRFAAHYALETRTPMVTVAMGGGARMQEGTPSMHRNIPKAQHALNELEEAGIPHISIIADPTLGGTAISYGLRGDYMIVVKGSANIGFSGKRVVEQFQQRKVAADFQHGTWLLHRGFVDERVATENMAARLTELLQHVAVGGSLKELQTRVARLWTPKKKETLNPHFNHYNNINVVHDDDDTDTAEGTSLSLADIEIVTTTTTAARTHTTAKSSTVNNPGK